MKIKVRSLKFVFSLIALFLVGFANCQTAKEVVKSLNKTYGAAKSYQMSVQVNIISGGKVIHGYRGESAKSGNRSFTNIMNRDLITNERCMVSVDHSGKTIVYAPFKKGQLANQTMNPIEMMDSLFQSKDIELSYYKAADSYFYVKLQLDDPLYDYAEMKIRKSDNALVQFNYKAAKNEGITYDRIEVLYQNVKLNGTISSDKFSEKKYLSVGKTLKPTDKYKEYQVIDQRKATNEIN